MGFKCLSLPAAIRVATCENRSSKRKRESDTMITQPAIYIEHNAEYYDSTYFKVEIQVPAQVAEVISMACVGEGMFAGLSCIDGELISVSMFEFDGNDEELLWADFDFGNAKAHIERLDDGSYLLHLICQKYGETEDDYLDYLDFGWRMHKTLPDLFWIEPANLIRKLIKAATKH
jgi:hypothetical protein